MLLAMLSCNMQQSSAHVANNGKENQGMLTQEFVKGLLTKQWNPMPDKNSKFAEKAEDKGKIRERERK